MATLARACSRLLCGEQPSSTCSGSGPACTGGRHNLIDSRDSGENHNHSFQTSVPTKLRDALAIGLFIVLAGYVSFSGIRLGLLLWQRFA